MGLFTKYLDAEPLNDWRIIILSFPMTNCATSYCSFFPFKFPKG